ncbi:dihydroneopterin aldolase [Fibrobacter sp. UWH9]|uniref:dihydroneopterin aldolase n=1 Tax=unclassified Fibrobacter TaxID=2634177 RepID=UPI00092313BB|nr:MULTISPECIES: dihydroneopterin aldolase [Fibrobacter]MCQ2101051.1 dihydroneopterin aldolase [Fibrobacter sp.]MCL4103264.1 Dihydroneopterin aldolase [Fibrobacter succinogenes]MDO4947796.1 dihydroneopterin aldolase [Fibrobacter sp.]OWV03960.1 dihydroneopterin aldolase [Fibrobacter sp. UWH3]OWV14846.1 dihydroneopterin aldolase [Fibrobacter sp. UWH1]
MVTELGKISLRDLTFDCIIGTLPYERENEQPIVLNVTVWSDFTLAARNEDLAHSIDYAQLAEDLKGFIRLSCFQLEETLVYRCAERILGNYPKAQAVEVSVRKPCAIPDCVGAESSIRMRR